MLYMGDFVAHAEKHKYILLAPNAQGTAFNDGSNRVEPEFRSTSDTGFLIALNAYLESKLATDTNKNYLAGFSSGASMAQRIVAESQGQFAAVISVSDHYWGPELGEVFPVSMLFIFGDSDPLNPMRGGDVFHSPLLTLTVPRPMQTAQDWARAMGCSIAITATVEPVKQRKWADCQGDITVMYLEVSNLGHFWAGGKVQAYKGISEREVGPYHAGFITTLVMWDYLNKL
ncbi:MAG: poly(3-hydroxybutyrate) depolymerase [Candidatus Azotimanducaceae bacterium]|jgi:poly(3-hydroxybutyrate) depolymerase